MKKVISVLVVLSVLTFYSCNKKGVLGSTSTVNFIGNVTLYDEGDSLLTKNGMTVEVENSNPVNNTLTDSSGNFTLSLDKVNTSDFALIYSKVGYGTFKRYYKLIGDSLYYSGSKTDNFINEYLGKKSSVTIDSMRIINNGSILNVRFNVVSNNLNGQKFVRLFWAKNLTNISYSNVPKTGQNLSTLIPVSIGLNSINIDRNLNKDCFKFNSGDSVYLTIYGDSKNTDWYTEKTNNTVILPNLNTNNYSNPMFVVIQ